MNEPDYLVKDGEKLEILQLDFEEYQEGGVSYYRLWVYEDRKEEDDE